MSSAQYKKMRKGAIRSFVVSLDSELAQVCDKSVRLRRSDTPLALRHRQDVRDFDEPPSRHKRRLGGRPIQQRRGTPSGCVMEQPRHGGGAMNSNRPTYRRPSLLMSLPFD